MNGADIRPANPIEPALEEALEGRLPVLPAERIYKRYGSLLWTTAVLSAASYAYLVGGALASFGNTRMSIAGYLVGLIVGEVVVVLAAGVPSFRSGVDTIDAAKSALGIRGAGLVLVTVLATCLGWAYVLVAMTAEGAGRLLRVVGGHPLLQPDRTVVVVAALVLIVVVWALARRGPATMERLSSICAPWQIAIAVGLFVLLVRHYGWTTLWARSGAPAGDMSTGRLLPLADGIELGFANALSLLPYLGGLTRMVRHSHHLTGPTVVGSGIVGAWIIATVAALAVAASGSSDPTEWILVLSGPLVGSAIVAFLLIANVGTLVVQVYVAAVGARQIGWVARLPWAWVLVIALAPGALLAFRTHWLLGQVATWLGYNGVMFVGMAAVLIADYFVIRRQQVELAHLYARPGQGRYWYHGGVNWLGVAVIVAAAALYMYLFDPITFRSQPMFRFAGAGIPTVLCAALVYACGAMLVGRSRRRMGRPASVNGAPEIEIGV